MCVNRTSHSRKKSDYANMSRKKGKTEMRERIAAWVRLHAKASGMTDERIAEAIGLSRDEFNKLKNNRRNALWQEVVALAQVFRTDPPTNLSLETSVSVGQLMMLRKSVAIGVWREEDQDMALSARIEEQVLPSVAYQGLEHYGRRVDDGHADLFVPTGYYVVCVAYAEARQSPNHGDYVVVQRRRRDITGGVKSMVELSIRRLERHRGNWQLKGLCSTPGVIPDIDYSGDTDELTILDLIVSRVGPVPTVM